MEIRSRILPVVSKFECQHSPVMAFDFMRNDKWTQHGQSQSPSIKTATRYRAKPKNYAKKLVQKELTRTE